MQLVNKCSVIIGPSQAQSFSLDHRLDEAELKMHPSLLPILPFFLWDHFLSLSLLFHFELKVCSLTRPSLLDILHTHERTKFSSD